MTDAYRRVVASGSCPYCTDVIKKTKDIPEGSQLTHTCQCGKKLVWNPLKHRWLSDPAGAVSVTPENSLGTGTYPGYAELATVLGEALHQAAAGKGKERHANNLPFVEQPIQQIADKRGIGFLLGQADKKAEEAHDMLRRGELDKAHAELLGAIVYIAASIIYVQRKGAGGRY